MLKRHLWTATFGAISLIAAVAMVLFRDTGAAYPLTAMASCAFVLAGIAGGAHRHGFGKCMLLGLILCASGDLIGVHHFTWGALCFLSAHLVFITAFLAVKSWRNIQVKMVPGIIAAVTVVGVWLLPHVPPVEMLLVIPYMVLLSTVVILASGVVPARAALFATLGASLFFVSDIFVARWRYVAPSPVNAYFCYPLYYTACVFLAFSIAAYDPATGRRQKQKEPL